MDLKTEWPVSKPACEKINVNRIELLQHANAQKFQN